MVELEYNMHGKGNNRILEIGMAVHNAYRFKQRVGKKIEVVKFKKVGNSLLAPVSKEVLAYTKPHFITFEKELMRWSSRKTFLNANPKLYGNTQILANSDELLDNMLEFVEKI